MRSQMTRGVNTIENPLFFRQTENYSLSQHWVIPYILSIQRERLAHGETLMVLGRFVANISVIVLYICIWFEYIQDNPILKNGTDFQS